MPRKDHQSVMSNDLEQVGIYMWSKTDFLDVHHSPLTSAVKVVLKITRGEMQY